MPEEVSNLPIYEYECTRCSSRFELKQSFNDEPVTSCPECDSKAIRVFFPVPIHFKGSGFYVTDSGGNHGHSSSNSDAEEKSGGEEKKVVSTSGDTSDTTETKKESTGESS